jgi:hypothetical protein
VNHLGTCGRWAFAELTDVYTIDAEFKAKVDEAFDRMIASATIGSVVEAGSDVGAGGSNVGAGFSQPGVGAGAGELSDPVSKRDRWFCFDTALGIIQTPRSSAERPVGRAADSVNPAKRAGIGVAVGVVPGPPPLAWCVRSRCTQVEGTA